MEDAPIRVASRPSRAMSVCVASGSSSVFGQDELSSPGLGDNQATPASCNAGGAGRWHTGRVQLRCVIVDDDASFLDAARAVLERDGVTVAGVALNIAEAVQRVEALRPDVVLIDIRLGEESGFGAVRQLATAGHAAALIMISTDAGEDYADLIADSPAAGFVPKAKLSGAAIRRILQGLPHLFGRADQHLVDRDVAGPGDDIGDRVATTHGSEPRC